MHHSETDEEDWLCISPLPLFLVLVELPLELEYCSELVYANFSSNPLSVFPDELTRMYSLRYLGLSDCLLEQLPRQFGR